MCIAITIEVSGVYWKQICLAYDDRASNVMHCAVQVALYMYCMYMYSTGSWPAIKPAPDQPKSGVVACTHCTVILATSYRKPVPSTYFVRVIFAEFGFNNKNHVQWNISLKHEPVKTLYRKSHGVYPYYLPETYIKETFANSQSLYFKRFLIFLRVTHLLKFPTYKCPVL